MKRLMKLAQLMGMSILFVGYSNCMQQQYGYGQTMYPQQQWGTQQQVQPVYGSAINVPGQNPFAEAGKLYPNLTPSAPIISNMPQITSQLKAPRPTLGQAPQPVIQPAAGIIQTNPVSPQILQGMQRAKNELWLLYQSAARTTDGTFANEQEHDRMYNLAMNISQQAQLSGNQSLKNASNALVQLFSSAYIYSIKHFVERINAITDVINKVITTNPHYYTAQYFQPQTEQLITEELIALPSTTMPLAVRAQRAAAGTLYDWTKPVIEPIGSFVQTGWGYAKQLGGAIKSGTQEVLSVAFPTQERIKNLAIEVDQAKIELAAARQHGNLSEVNRLTKEITDKEYLLGTLTGWSPWLYRAGLTAAAIAAYKTGAAGATARGTAQAGWYGVSGTAGLGASAVRGSYNYLTGSTPVAK
jgi:hypothetical protein